MFNKPIKVAISLWLVIDTILFGDVFKMYKANKLLNRKIKECSVEQFKNDERLKHSEERLSSALNKSVELVQKIEGKATNTLIGIVIAVSLISTTLGMIGDGGAFSELTTTNHNIVRVLFVVAMVYLISSGYLALQAYRIGEVYGLTLYDYAPLVEPSKQYTVTLYCIEQNQRISIIRSNRLSTCFNLLRNGILTLFILGITIILPS